jgi:hypothetical protein
MLRRLWLLCFAIPVVCLQAGEPSASAVAASIHNLSLDSAQTYLVRDIHWVRGDVSFYLNEGVLSFATPVSGRTIAAVFTTEGVEAGDAEVIVSPQGTGERASLAYFTKTPNLDEHFSEAVFLFTDDTRDEILKQIEAADVRKSPETMAALISKWQPLLREVAGDIDVPIVSSLLSGDTAGLGMFDAIIGGQTLGSFDVMYDPHQLEATTVGHVGTVDGVPRFQVWTSFAPRHRTVPLPEDPFGIGEYRIDVAIQPDLHVNAVSRFRATPRTSDDRVLDLQLSQLITVRSASIDGQAAEVLQRPSVRGADENDVGRFLVVASHPLAAGKTVEVEIHFDGSFVTDEGDGIYFVEARNVWFPYDPLQPAKMDLTFRCPANLEVVSSGTLVNETVEGSTRIVHRRLDTPVRLAGFNLGDFVKTEQEHKPFHIECFANRALLDVSGILPPDSNLGSVPIPAGRQESVWNPPLQHMCTQVAETLDIYSQQWGPLPIRNIAVAPISGTFGQGFPGLIYLSTISYLPSDRRPPAIRESILNTFFSDLLLPHELAHQWWGNLVSPKDYRSDWIIEALSNYAAFQLYEQQHGKAAFDRLMLYYRSELLTAGKDGRTIESTGPVDLGTRLKSSIGENSWRIITYDKGTWVIHMLRRRLGDKAFASFLRYLAVQYSGKTLTNEEFRQAACRFIPAGDPDRSLQLFFDAWIYGTGIPKLTLTRGHKPGEYMLTQSGVPDSFTADVPITMGPAVKWVRSSSEGTVFRVRSPLSTPAALPALAEYLYLQ